MNVIDLKEYMKPGVRGHLVGIGGVSMSPLAEALVVAGLSITGSDIAESETVTRLRGMGIPIAIGHRAENIGDAQFIVRTAAARDDNPEIIAARAAGIPVFERAQAWGFIMQGYENALCIAGTHGKTTTTSMATHILLAADADPTVMIGGTLPKLHAGHRIGKGKVIVLESCEYYNSFHSFFPTVAVILNIENDHMDFFKDLDDIKKSFRTFAERVPEDRGCVVANFDDANTMDALAGISRKVVTFGVTDGADVQGIHIVHSGTRSEFDVSYHGENLGRIVLGIPGDHNVLDALAAVASALCLTFPFPPRRRGYLNSAAPSGVLSARGAIRAPTSMTITPTTPVNSRPCWTPWISWITSGSSWPSSPIPLRGQMSFLMNSQSSSAGRASCFSRTYTPPVRKTPSALRLKIWPVPSPAQATARALARLSTVSGRWPVPETSF